MSMLAFFPWLEIEPLSIDNFRLFQFHRGNKPGGPLQPTIDSILAPYVVGRRPIAKATILQLDNHPLTQDLSEDERNDAFEFSELLAFSGLANREYFNFLGYTNRDAFNLIIQGFTEASRGVAVTTRRRDGSTTDYDTNYLIQRPEHVNGNPVKIDVSLLSALLKARELPEWPLFEEAIYSFNHANTDSSQISQQWEVIAISGAFERLLDCQHGKEDELASEFISVWQPTRNIPHYSCNRIDPARLKDRSIAEAWIRNFFQLRSQFGHGKRNANSPQFWNITEHLLLAAFAFPLAVKQILAMKFLYRPTDDDQVDIDVFEELACVNLFEEITDEKSSMMWPWQKIRNEEKFDRALESFFEKAVAEQLMASNHNDEIDEGFHH